MPPLSASGEGLGGEEVAHVNPTPNPSPLAGRRTNYSGSTESPGIRGFMPAFRWLKKKTSPGTVLLLGLLLCASGISHAEQLPARTYTTADGLPRDLITRIVRDSHGFLWFCTGDGLSRFNGYEFTTYGVEHGLPHPFINDLLETRRGVYWVATNGGGVARFNPSPLRNEPTQIRNLFTA